MIRRPEADAVEHVVERTPREVPDEPARRTADRSARLPVRRPPDEEAAVPRPERRELPPEAAPTKDEPRPIMAALASREELRRAFLLIEILGPPAALRSGPAFGGEPGRGRPDPRTARDNP